MVVRRSALQLLFTYPFIIFLACSHLFSVYDFDNKILDLKLKLEVTRKIYSGKLIVSISLLLK